MKTTEHESAWYFYESTALPISMKIARVLKDKCRLEAVSRKGDVYLKPRK